MSHVLLMRSPAGQWMRFSVSGHTGYAEAGQDIVCSALSFLSITCANALEAVARLTPTVIERDGKLEVILRETNDRAQTILELFHLGIKDLQQAYPKHIRLEVSELHN